MATVEHMSRPFQDVAEPVPRLAECIKMTPDREGHCVVRVPQVSFQLDPAPDAPDPDGLTVDPPSGGSPNRALNDDFNAECATDDMSEVNLGFASPPPTDVPGSCLSAAMHNADEPANKWQPVIHSRKKPSKQSNAIRNAHKACV